MSVTFEQFLSDWASTMWRASWQGGLVVLAVGLICWLFPRIPPRYQCWLWRIAVAKFVLVWTMPFVLHVPLLPAPEPALQDAIPAISASLEQADLNQPKLRAKQSVTGFSTGTAMLFLGWMTGLAWHLGRLRTDRRECQRVRQQGRPIADPHKRRRLIEQCELLGVNSSPALLETQQHGSPMLVGILRPSIVLPESTLRGLSHLELDMVLAHELAHIRRRDLWWAAFARVVRALFFYHPLVWLVERRLHVAQEIATDELTVDCQQCDPISYGSMLISITSKVGPRRKILKSSLTATGPYDSLTRRLSAMVFFGQTSRRAAVISMLVVSAVVFLGCLPWKIVAAQSAQTDDPSSVIRLSDIEAFFLIQAIRNDENCEMSSALVACEQGQKVGVTATEIPQSETYHLALKSTITEDGQFINVLVDTSRESLFSSFEQTTFKVPVGGVVLFVGEEKDATTGLALVRLELKSQAGQENSQVSLTVYFCSAGQSLFEHVGFNQDEQPDSNLGRVGTNLQLTPKTALEFRRFGVVDESIPSLNRLFKLRRENLQFQPEKP